MRRDLPVTARQLAVSHAARRSHLTRRMIQETGGSLVAFVAATAVWLASGASGSFWPVWVLLVVVMSLARNAWALYGPAADLDAAEAQMDSRHRRRAEHRERRDERRRGGRPGGSE